MAFLSDLLHAVFSITGLQLRLPTCPDWFTLSFASKFRARCYERVVDAVEVGRGRRRVDTRGNVQPNDHVEIYNNLKASTGESFAYENSAARPGSGASGLSGIMKLNARFRDGQRFSYLTETRSGASKPFTRVSSAPRSLLRPRLRLYPGVPLPPESVREWNTVLMRRMELVLTEIFRNDPRSVEISLESIGPSPEQAVPTVLVICSPVRRVKATLKKNAGFLFGPHARYPLKVCKGSFAQSHGHAPRRSRNQASDIHRVTGANAGYQPRPMPGASLGAWVGDRHLPPVSFGGLLVVDDTVYGITVHHILDDPGADDPVKATAQPNSVPSGSVSCSMATPDDLAFFRRLADPAESDDDEDFACEFSDSDSEHESALDLGDEYEVGIEAGDIPGVDPGCGHGYVVTQPAMDDVEEGFYSSAVHQDEEHLDNFSLGEVFASSGSRRRRDAQGLVHEIDWSLFVISDDRRPDANDFPRWRDSEQLLGSSSVIPVKPTAVAELSSFPNLEVQAIGRTSGLNRGTIMPALTLVKVYGRTSASHTFQVTSRSHDRTAGSLPLGVPGDSGAWIISRDDGRLCGHVLAFSQRKWVAYICPMNLIFLDIVETLKAREIRLPGGEPFTMSLYADVFVDDLGDTCIHTYIRTHIHVVNF